MDMDRLKGAARQVGGEMQSEAGRLTGDKGMQADGAAREAAGKAQGLYGEVKDQARRVLDEASDAAHDVLDRGSEYANHGARTVQRSIEGYPLAYLALAGAFGFLAALLLNERRR